MHSSFGDGKTKIYVLPSVNPPAPLFDSIAYSFPQGPKFSSNLRANVLHSVVTVGNNNNKITTLQDNPSRGYDFLNNLNASAFGNHMANRRDHATGEFCYLKNLTESSILIEGALQAQWRDGGGVSSYLSARSFLVDYIKENPQVLLPQLRSSRETYDRFVDDLENNCRKLLSGDCEDDITQLVGRCLIRHLQKEIYPNYPKGLPEDIHHMKFQNNFRYFEFLPNGTEHLLPENNTHDNINELMDNFVYKSNILYTTTKIIVEANFNRIPNWTEEVKYSYGDLNGDLQVPQHTLTNPWEIVPRPHNSELRHDLVEIPKG